MEVEVGYPLLKWMRLWIYYRHNINIVYVFSLYINFYKKYTHPEADEVA